MQTTWARGRDKPPFCLEWNSPSQVDHPRQPPVTIEPYRSPSSTWPMVRQWKKEEMRWNLLQAKRNLSAESGFWLPFFFEKSPYGSRLRQSFSQSVWRAVFKLNNIITINSVEIIVIIIIPEMMFRKQRWKCLIVRELALILLGAVFNNFFSNF